tara:strand:- start:24999 stop:25241 length:243 start_codon:yes stop_codon:yes gene_type:complete
LIDFTEDPVEVSHTKESRKTMVALCFFENNKGPEVYPFTVGLSFLHFKKKEINNFILNPLEYSRGFFYSTNSLVNWSIQK